MHSLAYLQSWFCKQMAGDEAVIRAALRVKAQTEQ